MFQNAGLHKMPDAHLGHDRDAHRVHNAAHQPRIGHAGHAALAPDVGGHALQSHDRAGPGLLGDFGLFGAGHVHDRSAFEHIRQAGFQSQGAVFHVVLLYGKQDPRRLRQGRPRRGNDPLFL